MLGCGVVRHGNLNILSRQQNTMITVNGYVRQAARQRAPGSAPCFREWHSVGCRGSVGCALLDFRMTFGWSAFIGFFLGFVFGVGCALAVMYSIYAGGYRAAVKDSILAAPPERLLRALGKARGVAKGSGSTS